MTNIIINMPDSLVLELAQSAAELEISFDDVVVRRLTASVEPEIEAIDSEFNPDEVAAAIYDKAVAFSRGSEFTTQELHRLVYGSAAWNEMPTGDRIKLGRAFKKRVDAEEELFLPDGRSVGPIKFQRKDQQNRAIYTYGV